MKPHTWVEIFLDAQQEISGRFGGKNFRDTFVQPKRMPIVRDFDLLAKRKPNQARRLKQDLNL